MDEAFTKGAGLIVSSPGTVPNRDTGVAGNEGVPATPNTIKGDLTNILVAPWHAGALFSDGLRADLDGDGDLDVGSASNYTVGNTSLIVANANTPQFGPDLSETNFHVLPNGSEFKISDVTFTVTSLALSGSTAVNFVVPAAFSAIQEPQRAQ